MSRVDDGSFGASARSAARRGRAAGSAWPPAATTTKNVTIGLITKQETNPFFVTMRETAAGADATNVNAPHRDRQSDVDNASQVAALAT